MCDLLWIRSHDAEPSASGYINKDISLAANVEARREEEPCFALT
jgi:hypothetical protein